MTAHRSPALARLRARHRAETYDAAANAIEALYPIPGETPEQALARARGLLRHLARVERARAQHHLALPTRRSRPVLEAAEQLGHGTHG